MSVLNRDCQSSRENRNRDGLNNEKTRKNLRDGFRDMFLKKVDVKTQIPFGMGKRINGNQVWENYQQNHVKLFSSFGNELRSFELEYSPVFNCCTSNDDLLLLVTQS